MSDWTPPADAKKVTPAASGWKPPSDAKKADGALFPSAPPASGEEGLGGPAVSQGPSTNGYAPQPRHLETGGLRPFKGLDAAAPRRPQMTPTALSPNRGTREDGTNKGPGWLGSIPAADGKEMTELSFDFDVDGKNIFAPLLVPTLSEGEVALLASGGEPTDAIYKKAQDFAIQRLDQGKSPFKEDPRSIVKKEKAEEIDLIGADRTTQQPSTIQAPQFDITPATAKQKKKAEEDARIEDRYQSEFSSATEEEVQKAKSVNQSMRSSIPAMEGAFLEGVERLKQQGQLLTDQRQILDSMDPSDPAYQGALDQYNERVKAFRKEQSGIELEALVVDDLVKKSAIDEFLLNRREHAIKAGHGNIPAAMGYASLDMLGKSMAGTLDVIGKVIPTDQEILEFAGALPEGSGTESRKEWRNYLKDVEKAPTRLTGIDQFVTPEYVDKKKDESLFAGGLIAVAEMAPAIAAGMATGGAGMGASFFTSSYRDLDQEMQGEYWDQIPEAEKEAIKVGTSFVSAGLSTMGMKALAGKLPVVNDIFFRAARKFAPGMSPGQLRRIIDAETKSYVANVASKIGQGFAIEGTEELADYGQEELVKHLYENYKRDELGEKADTLFQNAESIDQLGEGAWKSFVIGGIAGNMIGGSVAALSSVGARKRLSEKEFGVFKDLLESGSLLKDIEPIMAAQVAAGEMSQSDFDKTMEDVSKAESAISQIPEGLDIEATREAFDLLLEKDKLKTKDKILAAPKMQKIDEKLQALVGVPKEEEAKTEPTKKKAGTPDAPSKTVEWEGKDVQPKEQVTTPNENERTKQPLPGNTGDQQVDGTGESGTSSPASSGLETAPGMEAVAAGEASGIVPDASGNASGVSPALPDSRGDIRAESAPPTDTGTPSSVPAPAPQVTSAPTEAVAEEGVAVRYPSLRDASDNDLRILRARLSKDDTATDEEKRSLSGRTDRFLVKEKMGANGRVVQGSRLPTVQEIDNELSIRKGEKTAYDQTDRRGPTEIESAAKDISYGRLSDQQRERYSDMAGSSVPEEAMRFALAWNEYSKSPYGSSYYSTQQKDWNNTPDGSYRIADHWNFQATYPGSDGKKSSTINSKTDVPVKGWAIGRYDAKSREYKIIKQFDDAPSKKETPTIPKEGVKVVRMTDGKRGEVVAPHKNADPKKYIAVQWNDGKKESLPASDFGKWLLVDETAVQPKEVAAATDKAPEGEKKPTPTTPTPAAPTEAVADEGVKSGRKKVWRGQGAADSALGEQDGSGEEGASTASVQDEAPKPVAKKEAPSPGQGEGTTKSPYRSTSGKKYGGFSVTYDPEIGKMKTTMLGTPPPSGAEKFPAGSKERAKKSSNRIKAIRKARQEAEDELARKLGIAKDGRFERGSNALEKREEEKERRAAISKKADRLDEDALGVYGVVLRVMADGDMKITPESIAKYLGWGGGRNDGAMAERRKTEEETKASWTLDDGGEHINNAAHGMMEGSTMKDADGNPMDGWSEADFAEAIAQVASGYASSQEAYVQLERVADDLTEATLSPEDAITAHENAILNGLMEDADVEGNLDAAQASILNMSEAQLEAQYQDYLNTQRDENQEDTDGNDNQGAADSALGEQDDSGEEGASTVTVTEEDQDLADRISKLADDLDAPMSQRSGTPIGDTKTVTVDGKERTVFNSNGKPIHPTAEGVENFYKWFGDSKVVDGQGRPLVVYHGTSSDFDSFQAQKAQKAFASGAIGFFFSPEAHIANSYTNRKPGEKYAPAIKPVYLRAENLYTMLDSEHLSIATDQSLAAAKRDHLIDSGYDGVYMDTGEEYAVFDPTQIKSATGNGGDFDPSNPSILAQRPSPERTALESELTSAQKALDKALKDINKRGQSLFSDQEGTDQTSVGDAFDNSTENYDRILGPLRARLAKAKIELAKYDRDSAAGEASQGVLFQRDDYQGGHRPSENGPQAHDILFDNGEWVAPDDILGPNAARYYGGANIAEAQKAIAILRAIQGNPEAEVTIYRAGPKNELNDGDWITLTKGYAKEHAKHPTDPKKDDPVHSFKVKAKEIRWAGDDLNEFGYFPSEAKAVAQKSTSTTTEKTGKLRTDRVAAALKKLVPNLEIIAPKTKEEYAETTKGISEGLGSTWGIYDPRTNKLYLNPSSPDLRQTFFHEAAHPIIIALAKNNPELFSKFYEQLRTERGGKYIKFGQQYSDLSEAAQMAEALAEFFGDVAAGKVPVSTKPDSLYQQFKDFIKDILAALGWDMRSIDLSKPTDVRQFAAQMKKAFDKGIAIEGFAPLTGNKEAKVALQDDADRLVDGWYSRLDQAVAAKGNTQSGSDWLKWAEARAKEGMLSMEEVRWTGLAEFLDGKNKVTSQEVRDFLKENRVKVEVVENSNHPQSGTEDTKFDQYQLPGGENYREVLVTLPSKEASSLSETVGQAAMRVLGRPWNDLSDADRRIVTDDIRERTKGATPEKVFKSSHFDEPNILVHLRLNDRTDADGKKVLFIEELQSDWGQKGKKEGFDAQKKYDAAKRFYHEAWKPKSRGDITAAEGNAIVDKISKDTGLSPFELMDEASKWGDFTAIPSNIPSAPFVTDTNSWVELGLKQAIRMAVDGGYDRIAWTNGEQQNERYDLSKQVDTIEYHPSTNTLSIWAVDNHSTRPTQVEVVEPERLDDYVGKDVANRLLEQPLDEKKKVHSLSVVDLKVGGSGMKGFYDKILPNVAKKVSKKLGGDGKVGDTAIKDAGDQMSIEITDAMRDKVGLGVPLMQRPYGPIPTDTHKAALNAVAASVRAGEGLSKATAKGLKEVKASDWYKALDATQQAQAEADFKAPIKALATPVDKKPSTAPKKLQKQVMEAAGKKPAPKIVVNEKAALKDQIRMAAKNIRGERTRIAAARKEFVAAIKEAFKGSKGDFTAKQAAVVAHRAASVDPTNDLQVSRFLDYANKVIDNAEWADQVERADIMRGRAAKASKRKSVPYNHKEVLKQASEVDPAMLDNPGEYADIVQRYLGNIASPLSPQYAGTEQITEGEFQKYLSEWEAQMDQKYEDLLMDELGITVKKGQAKEIYKSIQEGTIDEALRQMDDPELKAEIESRVREMSQQRIAALKQHDTSGLDKEEVRIVKDIASADIDRLTVAQQADIIRASDNIILNNGFGGATLAASIASASNAVKPALDIAAKSGIRRALGIAQEFFSQSDAWTFFFGQAKDVGKIQNLVGFGDYVRGKAEFMKEQKKVRQDMEQFFSRLRAKYKDADSFENMTAEWVAGWVIQAMPKLNPKQSFEANKAMLQEDINRKMPTKSKKEAEMAQTVFDKIIAPANSREEALALLAKNYPSAKQSIDFMVNLFKPYRDRIQANSVRTWNMSGDYSDPYYLPKAFFTRGAKSLDVEPYSNKKNLTTMRPGQAGGTKARMTYRSLAENRLISPNIRNNVFSSLSDDLYGVATDAARMRLNEFMKMPDSNGVFGNEENKGFMAAMMHNYITAQDKSSGDQSEVSRWVNNRINDARTLASVQALAGFTQITRQLPEAVTQASVMMGRDFPLLFKNIPEVTVPSSPEGQGAANLMGNYAIGSREHAKAGMAWEGKVNSLNNAFQKAMQSGRFREAMKIRAKIQEVFMMSLMKGDLLSARAAWLGFYEKARKMDGHEVESWQTEASMHEGDASRQDAALYADTMVNRMTVSSDPAQAAKIARRGNNPWENASKAVLQAFVGTAIQQVGRRYAEVSTLGGYAYKKATGQKTGEAYDPKRALMSLVAGTTGNAVFLGSRLLIASALREAIGELYKWAVDDDDDEEPSAKAKTVFGVMTALYMAGMMDSDIFRAIDKVERDRGLKPKDPESESVKKYKLFKSQMLSEFIGSSIWQIADDLFIDGLNRMAYSAAIDAGDPSVFTKGGDPKPFRTWLQDPKNAPFYRYGQTEFIDRNRWLPDLDDAGILGVYTKNAGYVIRNYNNIFGNDEVDHKNEYQKAVKDIREASKERTEKASDIVARYEAGELTKEQSNKEFEKAFKGLPVDEYNKAVSTFLEKRRYIDAPDNVKEILDINNTDIRAKMAFDLYSAMSSSQRSKFDKDLDKAKVKTKDFMKEFNRLKSAKK